MFRPFGAIVVISFAALAAVSPTASAVSPSTITPHREASDVTAIAHRGASAYAPENTIAAFQLAGKLGADGFELDVQETKDHALVLMHDTTLSRTTDVERIFPGRAPWRVGDFTLAEIRKLDAGSWFADKYDGEPVPTLEETLHEMDGSGLSLLLEIKEPALYPGIEGRVADELRRNTSWLSSGRLIVQSFSWASMRTFHRAMPDVPIGLLGTPSVADLPKLAAYASHINPPYGNLSTQYVRRVHSLGMAVFAWTVDNPDTIRRLIAYGVDGIITNKPDTLASSAR
ncbi:glycerophosphodiester phosphodiesterase [Nonomuraea guangzhouensis]|uniref:Glycerophosphodiester phosphodiesterase n=1 Tax=Nonomuraea guangzhouensis TaxID=1291555 RepID=A0ABW4GZA0_9ACTN|nr:glycerophosphodiester phosphodiesterase family protein [Nonomuraea guangzhouensis]